MSFLLLLLASMTQATPAPGRIVIRFEDAKVSPTSVQINGPRSSRRDRNGQPQVTFDDLQPGEYDVQPIYDGGAGSAHRTLLVEAGKTATLTVGPEAVGAVQMSASPETCARAVEFGVSSIPSTPILAKFGGRVVPPATTPAPPPLRPGSTALGGPVAQFHKGLNGCFGLAGGLPPGSYQAFYTAADGQPISVTRFEIKVQEVATVMVGPAAVQLSGRVLYNDRPPVGAALQLFPIPRTNVAALPITAGIGPDGAYSLTMARAGQYSMSLAFGDGPYAPLSTNLRVLDGANAFDWSVKGGALLVSLAGWDRRTPVVIALQGAGTVFNTYDAQSPYPIRIDGLPLGVYTASAYQRQSGPVSKAPALVTLDEQQNDAAVRLDLVDNPGTIALQDEAGSPIEGGSIHGTLTDRAAESGRGQFVLKGLPLGVDLQVDAPGFVPACSTSTPVAQTITLFRGRSVDVVFARPSAVPVPLGAILIRSGAGQCVVTLTRLTFTPITTAPGAPRRFRFQNFPEGDTFIWQSGGERQEITVPTTGPVVIR
jgi:hypothetical protein